MSWDLSPSPLSRMTCLATSRCVPPSLWSPYPLLVSVLTWDENAENPRTPARRPPRVREPPRPLPQRAQGQVTQGDRGSPLACEVGSYTPEQMGNPSGLLTGHVTELSSSHALPSRPTSIKSLRSSPTPSVVPTARPSSPITASSSSPYSAPP